MNIINDWDFFWKNKNQFKLGNLTTEKPNKMTEGLSYLSKTNLDEAINKILSVDLFAFNNLLNYSHDFDLLSTSMKVVFNKGGRIFIAGCGATGRLALFLEKIWRMYNVDSLNNSNKIISLMAGGDAALVKSIEGFEDHEEYAVRHLKELKFNKYDLMIGVTEGGETPYVIGAVTYASNISLYNPYILYCNSDDQLYCLDRSNKFISSKTINNISLDIGSMAISGSTRMQASSILTIFSGLALLSILMPIDFRSHIYSLIKKIKEINIYDLKKVILDEYYIYCNKGLITYKTNNNLGLTILTDTTERAPTFSLVGFENHYDSDPHPSLCYLSINNCHDIKDAWFSILSHTPRTNEWNFSKDKTSLKRLYGFDINQNVFERRKKQFYDYNHFCFTIDQSSYDENIIEFNTINNSLKINCCNLNELTKQVLLKIVLNTHSTLIMALMDRIYSNIMTFVFPSNNKLIDRSIRYVQYLLLEEHNISYKYDDVAIILKDISKNIKFNESIVMKTFYFISSNYKHYFKG